MSNVKMKKNKKANAATIFIVIIALLGLAFFLSFTFTEKKPALSAITGFAPATCYRTGEDALSSVFDRVRTQDDILPPEQTARLATGDEIDEMTRTGQADFTKKPPKVIVSANDPAWRETSDLPIHSGEGRGTAETFLSEAENPQTAIGGVYRGVHLRGGKRGGLSTQQWYDHLLREGEPSSALEYAKQEGRTFEDVLGVENLDDFEVGPAAFTHTRDPSVVIRDPTGKGTGSPFLSGTTDARVAGGAAGEGGFVTEYAIPENRIATTTASREEEAELLIGRSTDSSWMRNVYRFDETDKTYTLVATQNPEGLVVGLSDPFNPASSAKVYDPVNKGFVDVGTYPGLGTEYVVDPATGNLVPSSEVISQ